MKINFWEENYYLKEQNINIRMSIIPIPRTFILFYWLTTQTCCLTSATEGKMCL